MTGLVSRKAKAPLVYPTEKRQPEYAVELYTTASMFNLVREGKFFEDIYGGRIAMSAAALPEEVLEAAQSEVLVTLKEITTEPGHAG